MKAIELFAGIGGFRLALDRLGIKTMFANDIEPSVCDVYRSNFGSKILHQGDIRDVSEANIPDHDILTAGFPCQPFSPAGKKLGVDCPTNGTLFEEIVRLLVNKRPKFFLLENVRRILSMENGRHFAVVLNRLSRLGYIVEWRVLNAISFGIPQHRQRIFIAGWLDSGEGAIAPRLRTLQGLFNQVSRHQMRPLRAGSTKFDFWGMAIDGKFIHEDMPDDLGLVSPPALRSILEAPECVDPAYDYTDRMEERLANSEAVNRFYNGVQILYNQNGGARFGYTVFGTEGVASTLTASTSRHYERYFIDGKYRRLTSVEYARLMGFPDDWCRVLSKYDQHSAYGNAVIPDCVEWAIRSIVQKSKAQAAA